MSGTGHHGATARKEPVEDVVRVEALQKYFPIHRGVFRHHSGDVHAVDGIDFFIGASETLGLVGESGCGKTTTGRLVARLADPTAGDIYYRGRNIAQIQGGELRRLRREIQIMFQDPYSSLSPRMTASEIIAEPLRTQRLYRHGGRRRVAELMEMVGLSANHAGRYPHQFSGGQRQRIGLARALALSPKVLVLDEPVSALDVSIQAQMVNVLTELQRDLSLTYLFISHDLSVVRHVSHRIAVMYLGLIVETGTRSEIYESPQHPYTQALLSAIPVADPEGREQRQRITLTGDVPSASNPPSGCRFRTRCWKAQEICAVEPPPLLDRTGSGHATACHFPDNVAADNEQRIAAGTPD